MTIFRLVQEGHFNMGSVVVRSGMSVGKSLPLLIQTLMLPINFSHPCVLNQRNGYAGSMRTRALSGAGTIHVNGEVLEYLIQGNQHVYCAVHTPQCRHTAQCRMPYEICHTGARILSTVSKCYVMSMTWHVCIACKDSVRRGVGVLMHAYK